MTNRPERPPQGHPPDSHWLLYANGEADAALRTLLDSHLAHCDACGALLSDLTEPGGQLLQALRPEPPPEALWERILAQTPATALNPVYPVPAVVRDLLPPDPEKAWRGLLKDGVRVLELAASGWAGAKLYLVHLRAGAAFPDHAHRGLEEAVILAGGARDGAEVLEVGDWRAYASGSHHQPEAFPDEDCWLLVRLEDEIKLSGWRGLLQRL